MSETLNDQIRHLALACGFQLESWMTNPPKPAQWHGTMEAMRKLVEMLHDQPFSITAELPDPEVIYYTVAYGDLSSGFTLFGPFEKEQAEKYASTFLHQEAIRVYPLAEARIMTQAHGFHDLTTRGYVVKP
jgi:hypothetical protein